MEEKLRLKQLMFWVERTKIIKIQSTLILTKTVSNEMVFSKELVLGEPQEKEVLSY